tara:strand:+ start:201 stop:455 length:255 start_codon:yes stop_codon:yes gene_type:complete
MTQMINNAAKATYLKFDALAKTMQLNTKSPTKDKDASSVKGLLQRIKQKNEDDEDKGKEQEPLEVALDYFIAIRQQRNMLKQKV